VLGGVADPSQWTSTRIHGELHVAGHGTVQLVTSFRRYKLLWPASAAAGSFTRTAAIELTRLGGLDEALRPFLRP
jgi:hypothetical protein